MTLNNARRFLGLAIGLTCMGTAQAQATTRQRNVAIFLFDEVQIIDYTGPYEVFNNAESDGFSRFKVYTVGEKGDAIRTIGGMTVIPTFSFANNPPPDVLVIPGGYGVYAQRKNASAIAWIKQNAKHAEVIFSVCNGAFLLSKAGLLDGLAATTTSGSVDRLKEEVPTLQPVYDRRFVDSGKVITSAGLSAGIDGALHVVEKLLGKGWAQHIALDMEYNWQPDSKYAPGLFAPHGPPAWWLAPGGHADPVVFEGGTDNWESKYLVMTNSSAVELFEAINQKVLANKKIGYTRRVDNQSTDPISSRWVFSDKRGQVWTCVISVEPGAIGTGTLLLTVKTARGDRPIR